MRAHVCVCVRVYYIIYMYQMCYYIFRSLFGGHTIGINGNKFGTSVDGVVVAMGNTLCAVQSINDTQIVCTTTSSASTHHVNNNAYVHVNSIYMHFYQ